MNRRRKALLQPNVAKLVFGTYLPEYATLMCVSKKVIELHGSSRPQESHTRASLNSHEAEDMPPIVNLTRIRVTNHTQNMSVISHPA